MTVKDLEVLYDYGCWATGKLFHVIAQLTTEQFRQAVGGSYGSMSNTVVHLLSTEWAGSVCWSGRPGASIVRMPGCRPYLSDQWEIDLYTKDLLG